MTGNADLVGSGNRFRHSGDLRNADAGNDPGGADGARPDTHLDGIRTGGQHRLGTGLGGDVAADHLHIRIALLDEAHTVEHRFGVAMRRIHHNDIGAGLDQRRHPVIGIRAGADAGAHPQLALPVLAGRWETPGPCECL